MADWKPISGSSYIPLPPKIKNKGAVINMKNEDNQCFKWCVVRALNPVEKNSERITKELKDQSERLNWSGLRFPVDLKQIKIFEKFNPFISINVFGFEDDVYPLRIPKTKKRINIDLLLISDEEKQHYCLINSLSRLISNKLTNHCGSVEICRSCLNHFPNKKKLKIHEEYCFKNEMVIIEMPKEGSSISFNHHNRSIKVPFVFILISKHSQKLFQHTSQMINFLLPNNIRNTNQVDFVINVLGLTQKGAFFIEGKMSPQNLWKCLRGKLKRFIKNSTFPKRWRP